MSTPRTFAATDYHHRPLCTKIASTIHHTPHTDVSFLGPTDVSRLASTYAPREYRIQRSISSCNADQTHMALPCRSTTKAPRILSTSLPEIDDNTLLIPHQAIYIARSDWIIRSLLDSIQCSLLTSQSRCSSTREGARKQRTMDQEKKRETAPPIWFPRRLNSSLNWPPFFFPCLIRSSLPSPPLGLLCIVLDIPRGTTRNQETVQHL